MTETTSSTHNDGNLADRATDVSADLLESLEQAQHAALKAVRQFFETVDEAIPAIGDRPTRREAVIDSAMAMVDDLVTAQYDFLRKVVHTAGGAVGRRGTEA